jgi:hypothetical protein
MKPVDRRELVLVWGLCLLGGLMMVNATRGAWSTVLAGAALQAGIIGLIAWTRGD